MTTKGRIALLIAVKELWFTFAYKWNRMPVSLCAARVCTPPFHHNQEKSDADTSCDGWQYYGEPSQPAGGMKNILLAASASMSLFAAAPVIAAATTTGLVDGTSKPGIRCIINHFTLVWVETVTIYFY